MKRLLPIVFVCVVLLLGMLPLRAQGNVPRFEEDRCPFKRPDGVDVDCGWLVVPETRGDDNSPEIRLAVAIYRAGRGADPTPLIYLDGGPGGPTLEGAAENWEGSALAFYAEDRDVVLIDQRGTGYSQPSLFCQETNDFSLANLNVNLTDAQWASGYYGAVEACRARMVSEGVNLNSYNSAAMAADIADLRTVLGYDEVNLLGISFGTRIALTVMRDHPEGIRSVIIDAVVPVQDTASGIGRPATYDNAFRTLFDACAADDVCSSAYPDLEAIMLETAARLEADPVTINITLDSSGEQHEMLLDGNGLYSTVFQALYATSILPFIPQMIYNASQGDYDWIALLQGFFQDNTISVGAYYTVRCHDEEQFNNPQAIIAEYQQYPDMAEWMAADDYVDIDLYFAACQAWIPEPAGALENEPVSSDIPTLVISGQFDPVTPAANGDMAAETLPNSYVFTFPATGHGASFSSAECPRQIVNDFLARPDRQPDSSCIDAMGIVFDIPVQSVDLVEYRSRSLGISAVRPEGWEEVDTGFFVAASTNGTILWYLVSPDGNDFLGPLLENYTGSAEIPAAYDRVSGGGLDWDIYRFPVTEFRGYGTIATAEADSGARYYIIIIGGTRGEDELLYDDLLLPAIEAFEA